MIIEASVYLIVFGITAFMAFIFQNFYNLAFVKYNFNKYRKINTLSYCVIGCIFLLPIIAMFGLRYGIGTDYFSYEEIFNDLHGSSIRTYFLLNNDGNSSSFYVEFGYYLLNVIFPSYRSMLWGIATIVISLLFISLRDYSNRISFALAFFIYFSTQFIYLMNGMRFAIAIVFALVGYVYLAKNKTIPFLVFIFIAVLFHKSCLICLAMYFLKQIKFKSANNARNILLLIGILSFPALSKVLLKIAANISLFERYFSKSVYSASETMNASWVWILHIVPVLLPLIFLCRNEIFDNDETKTLFRICVMEIPLRMLGFFNTWYTRLSRISQITYVLFIPLILSKVKDKNRRVILYIYYVIWFIFYFAYYAIVNDQGASLPYTWIFNM
jgi:hypothetical protein